MNFYFNQQAVLGATNSSIVVTIIASLLIWFMFLGLIVLWIVDGRIKKEDVFRVLLASFLAWAIARVLKDLLPSARPFIVNRELPLTLTLHFDNAFPSSHAAIAFALATTIWLHSKKLGIVFFGLAILVAIGRVTANVHYVLDVVFGSMIGTGVAVIVERLPFSKSSKSKK